MSKIIILAYQTRNTSTELKTNHVIKCSAEKTGCDDTNRNEKTVILSIFITNSKLKESSSE
jgi:hypothetical protein